GLRRHRLVGPDLVDVRADPKPLLRGHGATSPLPTPFAGEGRGEGEVTTSLASSSSARRSYRSESWTALPVRPGPGSDLRGARLSVWTVLSHQRSVLGSVPSGVGLASR